jgi:hypothetical protein
MSEVNIFSILSSTFEVRDNGYICKFGKGYELFFEGGLYDDMYQISLYKNGELIPPKVRMKLDLTIGGRK